MRSRSRTVSRRRRTLPASETASAAGCASSSATTRRHGGKRRREQPPLLGLVTDSGLEGLQDLLLAARAHPGEVAQPPGFGRGLQPVERGDAELHPDARRGLGSDSRKPEEVDDTRRDETAALRERVHLAVLDDLDGLRLDRLSDPGQLLRLALERELGDRQRRLPDPPRRPPVGDHLERLLFEDLREIRQELELIRELAVPGQRPGHPAMILRCLARSSASRRTTSGRTSSR